MLRRQQAENILSAREKIMKSAATSVKMEHKRIKERLEKGVKERTKKLVIGKVELLTAGTQVKHKSMVKIKKHILQGIQRECGQTWFRTQECFRACTGIGYCPLSFISLAERVPAKRKLLE